MSRCPWPLALPPTTATWSARISLHQPGVASVAGGVVAVDDGVKVSHKSRCIAGEPLNVCSSSRHKVGARFVARSAGRAGTLALGASRNRTGGDVDAQP